MNSKKKLREIIRQIIMQEFTSTASGGAIGTAPNIIQTPNAFVGGASRGKRKMKKIARTAGFKPVKKRGLKESKMFEDVINKVGFDIKFSDQAKDLMDYIHSNEKFEDDLQDITTLFQKMQDDGVFSKQEAFKVYKDFVERAAREYARDNKIDVPVGEYFLTKDLLDVIYYHLSKMETPQSGLKDDNIDVPPGGEQPPAQPPAPEAGAPETGAPPTGTPETGAPPTGTPPAGTPPAGEAPAPATPPTGEAPPEGEEEAPEGAPKPEEVTELRRMVNEIMNDLKRKR